MKYSKKVWPCLGLACILTACDPSSSSTTSTSSSSSNSDSDSSSSAIITNVNPLVWYSAASIDPSTNTVASWPDLSANSSTASYLVNSTDNNNAADPVMPVYASKGINGLPAVGFLDNASPESLTQLYTATTASPWLTENFTVVAVVRPVNQGVSNVINYASEPNATSLSPFYYYQPLLADFTNSDLPAMGLAQTTTSTGVNQYSTEIESEAIPAQQQSNAAPSNLAAAAHVLVYQSSFANGTLSSTTYIDGVQQDASPIFINDLNGTADTSLYLGGSLPPYGHLFGYMSELAIYNTELTLDQITEAQCRLLNKYGLSFDTSTLDCSSYFTTPATPSNLTASISNGGVQLTWTAATSKNTAYQILRYDSVSGQFTAIGQVGVGVTSYHDYTVASNTAYQYEVASYVAGVTGSTSDPVSITTLADGAMTFNATNTNGDTVQPFAWYKADTLLNTFANGDNVTSWPDSSGNGFTAAASTYAPTFNNNNVFSSGLPAINFATTSVTQPRFLQANTGTNTLFSGPSTTFVVFTSTPKSVITYNSIISDNNYCGLASCANKTPILGFAATGISGSGSFEYGLTYFKNASTGYVRSNLFRLQDSQAHVLVIQSAGVNSSAQLAATFLYDGMPLNTSTPAAVQLPTGTPSNLLAIGGGYSAPLYGNMGELIVFNSQDLSSASLKQFQCYLALKYGVTNMAINCSSYQ